MAINTKPEHLPTEKNGVVEIGTRSCYILNDIWQIGAYKPISKGFDQARMFLSPSLPRGYYSAIALTGRGDVYHVKILKRKNQSVCLMTLKWVIGLWLNVNPDHFKASTGITHRAPTSLAAEIKQSRFFSIHPSYLLYLASDCDTPHEDIACNI